MIAGPVLSACHVTISFVMGLDGSDTSRAGEVTITIGTAGPSSLSRTPIFKVMTSSGVVSTVSTLSVSRPSRTSTLTV